MLLRFVELGSAEDRAAKQRLRRTCQRLWSQLERGLRQRQCAVVLGSRVEVMRTDDGFVVRESCRAARPWAELLVELAPHGPVVHHGIPAQCHDQALATVTRECGTDLSRARVRMGFTRGHLLEVVVLVPLDIRGSMDELQFAAETYLEHRLGDDVLDTWVHSVGVDRIARTKGLVMVSDARATAESFPLCEAHELTTRAIAAVTSRLPQHLRGDQSGPWTALEMSEGGAGEMQRERRYASTCFPEALKCALEGMPFDSRRFTRGGELFSWVRWRPKTRGPERAALRERVERRLLEQPFDTEVVVAGFGFGAHHDYLDLWLQPRITGIRELGTRLRALCGQLHFGFYDSNLSGEVIAF